MKFGVSSYVPSTLKKPLHKNKHRGNQKKKIETKYIKYNYNEGD